MKLLFRFEAITSAALLIRLYDFNTNALRKSFIYTAALGVVLLVAYVTKPSDKKCIIESVSFVWGNRVPNQKLSRYYEAFMNATSKDVVIDDWIFGKRIRYKFRETTKTVAFGAFNHVFSL